MASITQELSGRFRGAEDVTPSDTADSNPYDALYVGGAGNLKVSTALGTDATFSSVPAGTLLKIRVSRVYSTGSTATNVVGLTE